MIVKLTNIFQETRIRTLTKVRLVSNHYTRLVTQSYQCSIYITPVLKTYTIRSKLQLLTIKQLVQWMVRINLACFSLKLPSTIWLKKPSLQIILILGLGLIVITLIRIAMNNRNKQQGKTPKRKISLKPKVHQ